MKELFSEIELRRLIAQGEGPFIEFKSYKTTVIERLTTDKKSSHRALD